MEYYSGQYGFVLLPTKELTERAIKLHSEINGNLISKSFQPHVTLFHARVKNLPEDEINRLLKNLAIKSWRIELQFNELEVFGGHFIFWNTMKTEPLMALHMETLGMARYLDRKGISQSNEESLNLAEREKQNVKRYGHPLVGKLWQPHITIAYCDAVPELNAQNCRKVSKISQIAFVAVGKYGTIRKIEKILGNQNTTRKGE